jgi:uncharacterized protein YcfL
MARMECRPNLFSGFERRNLSMYSVFIYLILLALTNCGSHQQNLFRIDEKSLIQESKEKDLELILINAVNAGDLKQIEASINQGIDINIRNNDGLTLIMIAITAQQFAVMELLVNKGVNLELTTQTDRIKPDKSALEFLEELKLDNKIKTIMKGILTKQEFPITELNNFIFSAISDKNIYLVDWVLKKGVSPNLIRMTSSGKEDDSPLIYLFSLKGVKDLTEKDPATDEVKIVAPNFQNLKKIFYMLVSHPDIDVNRKVGRDTPLGKAKTRLKQDANYQEFVDKLTSMGAKD